MIVAARTCWPADDSTSDVKILRAFPVSPIISGSHRIERTSPTTGSIVLNGRRISSRGPAMKLKAQDRVSMELTGREADKRAYPGTVMK